MIDDHVTKVAHGPGHIQFINSINDDQYENAMSYNNIDNPIVQKGETRKFCGKTKSLLHTKNHLLYCTLIPKELGEMLWFNGR